MVVIVVPSCKTEKTKRRMLKCNRLHRCGLWLCQACTDGRGVQGGGGFVAGSRWFSDGTTHQQMSRWDILLSHVLIDLMQHLHVLNYYSVCVSLVVIYICVFYIWFYCFFEVCCHTLHGLSSFCVCCFYTTCLFGQWIQNAERQL